jgi:hypothetical protein
MRNLYRTQLSVIILLISIFAFNVSHGQEDKLHQIDLTQLSEKDNPVYLSKFASEITYLPLESKKECLIGPGLSLKIFDSIIVCSAHQQILLFDSHTGQFIKPIGEYGHGPNGFINSLSSYLKNGEIIITAIGWDYPLIEFSAVGEIQRKFKFKERPRDIAWLNKNLYAVYYYKQRNADTLRVMIYDSENDKLISGFYDKRVFRNASRRSTNFGARFYTFRNKLFIKEYLNDTVFQVTANKMTPSFVFKSGKFSPPFYEMGNFDHVEYHGIGNILETDQFIFFQLHFKKRTYYCCYDKRTKQVMIPNYKTMQINEFENDIDGFMPFHPISVTGNNDLVGYLEPYKIRKWMAENPDKAARLPQHLQKFRNIKETDNPVVILLKLKD